MIIPDLNLLLYAYTPSAPMHAAARRWWEQLLRDGQSVGLPWAVTIGFVRLSTTRSVLAVPATPHEALQRVESWFAQRGVFALHPGPQHLAILRRMLAATSGGALTTDAHLATLAIENQAELHSDDSDFGRFPGLRWRNPLEATH